MSDRADFVIIGSGAAGATAAMVLAEAGARVIVLEEGPAIEPSEMVADSFGAMRRMYRDMGCFMIGGSTHMPALQGRLLGGSTVFNGGICWTMPEDVYAGWLEKEPALADALPYERLVENTERVHRELGVETTHAAIMGANNSLLERGAAALGIEGRPILRAVKGCEGLGRCLQGCPRGHKQSMDRSFVARARTASATILTEHEALRITTHKGRATGVLVARKLPDGSREVREVRAKLGVLVAASAIQTPVLLYRSGIRHGPLGEFFRCHPGVSMAGFFPEEVRMWEGATQGYEVTGLRHEGIKIEALGYGAEITAGRLKSIGSALSRDLATLSRWANWGAAIKARGTGRVRAGLFGGPRVSFHFLPEDVRTIRRAVVALTRLMLAAGAAYVTPGIHGGPAVVKRVEELGAFEDKGPDDPRAYAMAVTHMMGTARMGKDPRSSVVGLDFEHHVLKGLFVIDSSVFVDSLGVNPQSTIMAIAMAAASSILARA